MMDVCERTMQDAYPAMPAVSVDELLPYHPVRQNMRRVGRFAGGMMLAGAFMARPIAAVDTIATGMMYPDTTFDIVQAEGSRPLSEGSDVWLVTGGHGQTRSDNAAKELAEAFHGKESVFALDYPDTDFTVDDVAASLMRFADAYEVRQINIVGRSMGLSLMLKAEARASRDNRYFGSGATRSRTVPKNALRSMPTIGYFAASSSPADSYDAIKGGFLRQIIAAGEAIGYSPGLFGKFIYCAFDGQGDAVRTLNIADKQQWLTQLSDTLQQTFNRSSPKTVWAQMKILALADAKKDLQGVSALTTPNTMFIYLYASQPDPIVNTDTARKKYEQAARDLGIGYVEFSTGSPGHANSIATAQALAQWFTSRQSAQSDVGQLPNAGQ